MTDSDARRERLSAYLDDALTPPERTAVEAELAHSPELSGELETLRRLRRLLKDLPVPLPPAGFTARAKRAATPSRWRRALPPLVAMAAAALLTVRLWEDHPPRTKPVGMNETGTPSKTPADKETLPLFRSAREGNSPTDTRAAAPEAAAYPATADAQENQSAARRAETRPRLPLEAVLKMKPNAKSIPQSPTPTGEPLAQALPNGGRGTAPGEERERLEAPALNDRISGKAQGQRGAALKALRGPGVQEWRGEQSGVRTPREVVIETETAWKRLWAEHVSPLRPAPPPPVVDFKTHRVIGVFLGERPSSGYGVQITDVTVGKDAVLVSYVEWRSGLGMQAAVMTHPYHLKIIPTSALPVRFNRR